MWRIIHCGMYHCTIYICINSIHLIKSADRILKMDIFSLQFPYISFGTTRVVCIDMKTILQWNGIFLRIQIVSKKFGKQYSASLFGTHVQQLVNVNRILFIQRWCCLTLNMAWLLCQRGSSGYFRNCCSIGIFTHNQLQGLHRMF